MLTLLPLTLLACYLIGAIPFGYLVARWVRGIDIRQHGSGNIGATNVGRVLGWRWFGLVFALDFLKGAGPVLLARSFYHWLADRDASLQELDLATLAGLAAILGHMFPIYLGFRGGKGVATSAGVIAMLAPWPTLVAAGVWGLTILTFRYVSLSSMLSAVALCVTQLVLAWPAPFAAEHRTLTLFCLLAATLIVVRHRTNIVRLCRGTEPKIGQLAELENAAPKAEDRR